MMDCTDRHDRYFLRLLSPNVLLYTEMVTTGALIHGDRERFLKFHSLEHPIALQLGGSDPIQLAQCAKFGEEAGYDEINLNVGCPSDRVKSGKFGACLMLSPQLVADCVAAMVAQVKIPVTVKCRIGVDNNDSYAELCHFIQLVTKAGCNTFIIHARKAWLNGLSPKENREIPPLQYEVVKQIKKDFPHLTIIINGGFKTITQIEEVLPDVDGVMIGREAYSNPYLLQAIEKHFFNETNHVVTREKVLEQFMPYIETELKQNTKLAAMLRHTLGLFHAEPGARLWRRHLSENMFQSEQSIALIYKALTAMQVEPI